MNICLNNEPEFALTVFARPGFLAFCEHSHQHPLLEDNCMRERLLQNTCGSTEITSAAGRLHKKQLKKVRKQTSAAPKPGLPMKALDVGLNVGPVGRRSAGVIAFPHGTSDYRAPSPH